MNLSDAFNLLESENCDSQSRECLITREPIKYEIKLKCGHYFEYSALLNNLKNTQQTFKYHSCPYCRSIFKNFIPLYEVCVDEHSKDIDYKMFRKNDYLTCHHVFSSGKRKGECCTKNANKYKTGIFCPFHLKQKQCKNQCSCSKILKNGKTCKNAMYDADGQLCKLHYNKQIK